MRILVVSQYFWPEAFRINDLVLGLKEKGHQVTVLTGIPNYPKGKFFEGYGFWKTKTQDYEGIEVIRVPLIPRFAGKGWQLVLNYLSFALFASFLGAWKLKNKRFDVIFVYQTSPITSALPAIIIKKLKKIPLHLWVQDLWPESLSATGAIKSKSVLALVGKLVTFIYDQCDVILVSSKSFASSVERYRKNKKAEIRFFPNSAEDLYKPKDKDQDFAERFRIPIGFNVMFAGNVGYAQDFPNILDAAEILKDQRHIHFVVLGEGRNSNWVKDQVKKRDLEESVHILGAHPVELMPQFFAHADVMLVTLRDEPVFKLTVPAKIQSYLACGKPIISALAGEGGQVIEESGAGISVTPGDPRALADAVIRMANLQEASRKEMSGRALDFHNQNYQRDLLITKLETWLHA